MRQFPIDYTTDNAIAAIEAALDGREYSNVADRPRNTEAERSNAVRAHVEYGVDLGAA
jgi:hypothetical protein